MKKKIFDLMAIYEPPYLETNIPEEFRYEPSIRQMVYKYYAQHFDHAEAEKYTNKYLTEIYEFVEYKE